MRRSPGCPVRPKDPVPQPLLDAGRDFALECGNEGKIGQTVIFRKASRLLEQLPEAGCVETRQALESFDPQAELCVCGEVLRPGSGDEIYTVAARLPLATFREKQDEQRKRWATVRERVESLKRWGNEELKDNEVGTELAEKTYREALRLLVDSMLQDGTLEMQLRLNLAEALARLGKWEESAEESGRALELDEEETLKVKALFRRGRAHLRLDRAEEAIADLRKAARLEPTNRAVRQELEAAKRWRPKQPAAVVASTSAVGGAKLASKLWRMGLLCGRQALFGLLLVLVMRWLRRRRG